MTTETLIKVRSNPLVYNYLRINSKWYKALNRDDSIIKVIEQEAKDYYKLNLSDKLNNLNQKLDIFRTFMDIIN